MLVASSSSRMSICVSVGNYRASYLGIGEFAEENGQPIYTSYLPIS